MSDEGISLRRRHVAGRFAWGLGDQAVSSLTNFVFLVVAARSLDREGFGALSLALAAYAVTVGVVRALTAEPLAVRYGAAGRPDARAAARAALGTSCWVGLLGASLAAAVGLAVAGDVGKALLPLALVLPGLALQDTWRFSFTTLGCPRSACTNDLVWAGLQLGLIVAFAGGGLDITELVLAWGLAGAIAALVAPLQAGFTPELGAARGWLREHRDLWRRFVPEFLALAGAWQVALVLLGALAGLDVVGALRAGQLLVGPLNVAFLAVPLVAVPESARLWRAGHGTPVLHASWIGGVLAMSAAAWGFCAALIPTSTGQDLLGVNWGPARSVLVPITLVMVAVGANLGAFCGLRVLGAARSSLTARLIAAPAVIAASVAGGLIGGASGAAWGWAIASVAMVGVWWWQLHVSSIRMSGTDPEVPAWAGMVS